MPYAFVPKQQHVLWAYVQRCIVVWQSPLWSGMLASVVYGLFTARAYGGFHWYTTPHAYFNYLADAFLHGQLYLRVQPAYTLDLSIYHDRLYLYWPPFPSILLLPFVSLWGIGFSDTLFSVCIAGFNVSLVAILLRQACQQAVIQLSQLQRALLVLFFALGTVHTTLAPYGGVWFVGQLVGFSCVALAYLAAIRLRGVAAFTCAGMALAFAFLTRNHLILTSIWPACYLLFQHRLLKRSKLVGCILAGTLPFVIGILLFGAYNRLRFGSAFDNGLAYHQMSSFFRNDYQRYGAFNTHYLPTNLFYQYVAYPLPLRPSSAMGGSLFILSPVFLGSLWALIRGRPRWSIIALFVTIGLTALPILLLMGTGYKQFGPRYTLDFTVPLLLLTAIGVQWWPNRVLGILTGVSLFHYMIGAFVMYTILVNR